MTDVADRARDAHEAKKREKELQEEADAVRWQGEAEAEIDQFAAALTVTDLIAGLPVERQRPSYKYELLAPLTDDATLRFVAERAAPSSVSLSVSAQVIPCDQLYWDLPPGVEEQSGGGTYGAYGLSGIKEVNVSALAEIGAQLARIDYARTRWRKKYGHPA